MDTKKAFWFDVETTGLESAIHGIVQLAGIVEINGEIKHEFDFKIRPFPADAIDDEALLIHGYTREAIQEFASPKEVYVELLDILGTYVNKFDKTDKFYPGGYNVSFDYGFLQAFFTKCCDKYFGSWFNHRKLDPLPFLWRGDFIGKYRLENYKLETVAKHFGVDLVAHDALSDVRATREIFRMV